MKEDHQYNISVSLKYRNSFKRIAEISHRNATYDVDSHHRNSSQIRYEITVVICETNISFLDKNLIKVEISDVNHWTVDTVSAVLINATTEDLMGDNLNHTLQVKRYVIELSTTSTPPPFHPYLYNILD